MEFISKFAVSKFAVSKFATDTRLKVRLLLFIAMLVSAYALAALLGF
ncbi:hypothetical protein J4441_00930 [Candidatus Micrarchaeota archaeon]|nr:hypothetical protein [Candidatus Micrarchaeota archaeon]